MENVKVLGSCLYQWEIGRVIEITPPDNTLVSKVEFAHTFDKEALAVKPREENGVIVADIPNILLQSGDPIFVYLVYVDANCLETTASHVLSVVKRPKPADYVYTETEVLTWEALDERLKKLEGQEVDPDVVANAVEAYMAEHPIEETDPTVPAWAKAESKPTYTAQEVGALPDDTKIPTEQYINALINDKLDNLPIGGVEPLLVTVENNVASHTSAEIYAHIGSGGAVYLVCNNFAFTLDAFVGDSAYFTTIYERSAVSAVVKADGTVQMDLAEFALKDNIPTTEYINSLIDTKLGVIENGSY
jgi:hypothetical protein